MTTSSRKYTNEEYIETFNLDPNKDIDKQMYDLVEKENFDYYVNKKGMTPENARKKAKANRRKAGG